MMNFTDHILTVSIVIMASESHGMSRYSRTYCLGSVAVAIGGRGRVHGESSSLWPRGDDEDV